jgi:hypothetical protein
MSSLVKKTLNLKARSVRLSALAMRRAKHTAMKLTENACATRHILAKTATNAWLAS